MVDEQRFEHAFTHLFHGGRLRVNFHARRNWRRAGDRRTRRLGDLERTVGIDGRLAVGAERGRAELDEAHAAVADDRQLRMPAVMRHVRLGQFARLDHRRGRELAGPVGGEARHFDFAAVHLDLDLLDRGRGRFCFNNVHELTRLNLILR